jgi:hypothetical protein
MLESIIMSSKKPKPRCELMTDPAKRAAANERTAAIRDHLPAGLSQPALRALDSVGVKRLKDLTRFTEGELLELHGMGPKAMTAIRAALTAENLALRK